jgi:flagellar biosynthesis/type III secretory pathway protein FliH
MIESAAYEIIKKEGYEEGLRDGIQQGIKQGIQQGIQQGIKQGLLEGIEVALEVKFGLEGVRLMKEIREIGNTNLLKTIKEGIRLAGTIEDIRRLYSH